MGKLSVNQYRVTDARISSSDGVVSVQSRNFSPILSEATLASRNPPASPRKKCLLHTHHASIASGLAESVKPTVAGFVDCCTAYAVPNLPKSTALSRPFRSWSSIESDPCVDSSGQVMTHMLTVQTAFSIQPPHPVSPFTYRRSLTVHRCKKRVSSANI